MNATTRADARRIHLVDVSLRDGLQDEAAVVSLDDKVTIARSLSEAGFTSIEATSFVHPRWVPQLADADRLVGQLPRGPRYSALVLNRHGYERAVAAFDAAGFAPGEYDLVFVVSASARHAFANNNRTIDESLAIFDGIGASAAARGVTLRAVVACAFGSPWPDEPSAVQQAVAIATRFAIVGVRCVTLADTVGLAGPQTTRRVLDRVRTALPQTRLALHLHDRTGQALDNIAVALEIGVATFEGALAGLGGCPFAPDAPGNIDLVRVAAYLNERGYDTGIERARLPGVADRIRMALATAAPLSSKEAAPA